MGVWPPGFKIHIPCGTIHYEARARYPISYETHLFVLYEKKNSTIAFYENFSSSFLIYMYTQDDGILAIKTAICGNKDIWELNPSSSHKSSFKLLLYLRLTADSERFMGMFKMPTIH